jgi:hypothetical protein
MEKTLLKLLMISVTLLHCVLTMQTEYFKIACIAPALFLDVTFSCEFGQPFDLQWSTTDQCLFECDINPSANCVRRFPLSLQFSRLLANQSRKRLFEILEDIPIATKVSEKVSTVDRLALEFSDLLPPKFNVTAGGRHPRLECGEKVPISLSIFLRTVNCHSPNNILEAKSISGSMIYVQRENLSRGSAVEHIS